MKKKNKPNKWIRVLIYAAIFIIVVLIGNVALKSVIEKKIRTASNQFAPYIKTDFATVHINLFAASINIDSIIIKYQPNLKLQNKHEIFFNNADIIGINFFKIFSGKIFSASALKLKTGKINLSKYLLSSNDTLPAGLLASAHIPFKNIGFSLIEIKDANVFEDNTKAQKILLNLNISFNDIKLNNIDSSFSKNNIHFSNVECKVNKINYDLPGYHSLNIKTVLFSSKDSTLKIDSLKIIPQLGKIQLGNKLRHQADYINAEVANIKFAGVDAQQLMSKKFFASNLDITGSKIYVFRDRRLPLEIKQQPLPLDYLKKIPADVYINHFNLKDASVTSEEFPKDGPQTGYIKIEHVNIIASPFFNHPQKNNSFVTTHVTGSIMDAGTIEANINLSLINGDQNIKGYIENLSLPAMNPSAENLGKFKVESGVLNRLDFQFTATKEKATGKIVGVYHNLVIDKLKLKKGRLKVATLPSFVLHHIIIPKDKDALLPVDKRTGKIDYKRDPARLVTFYLLKALLDGIRNSFSLGFVLPK